MSTHKAYRLHSYGGPETITLDEVPLPTPGPTQALVEVSAVGMNPFEMRVLVHGASGTVGAFVVQFAKAEGAFVIGTASAKNRDYVLSLGTDEFVDYQLERFEDRVTDVDLVIDCVLLGGTMSTTDRSWGVLKPNGAIATVADPSIPGKTPVGFRGFFPQIEPDADQLELIAAKLASGQLRSKIARVFDRSQLVEAMELNKAGGTAGRLIVDFKRI